MTKAQQIQLAYIVQKREMFKRSTHKKVNFFAQFFKNVFFDIDDQI